MTGWPASSGSDPGVIGWLPCEVDRIAEVGAGTGRLTMELAERGQRSWRWSRRRCAGSCGGSLWLPARRPGSGHPRVLRPGAAARRFRRPGRRRPGLHPLAGHGGEAGGGWRWRRRAGRAGAWPSSGRRSAWLTARGYRHVSFPGPMSVEFGSHEEAVELAEIFYPSAAVRYGDVAGERFRSRCWASTRRATWPTRYWPMKVAIMAPLVTAIREPQRGGSQAFVSDLARGLTRRGHDVHVYAASGSEIPGVEAFSSLQLGRSAFSAATLYRASGAAEDPAAAAAAAEGAFAAAYGGVRDGRYDVVHNHAFDAPAVRLAGGAAGAGGAHGSPAARPGGVGGAPRGRRGRQAAGGGGRIGIPGPRPGAGSCPSTRSCRRTRPRGSFPGRGRPGRARCSRARRSPEKGAAEAIDIARAARVADRR